MMTTSLWDYAVALYARPGVQQACLHLQDSRGANTNLLLFARWLETRCVLLNSARLDAALALINNWDLNYVQNLRELRRKMKTEFASSLEDVEQVRNQIKKAELYAEQKELEWLEVLSTSWTAEIELKSGENIAAYLKRLGVPDNLVRNVILGFVDN